MKPTSEAAGRQSGPPRSALVLPYLQVPDTYHTACIYDDNGNETFQVHLSNLFKKAAEDTLVPLLSMGKREKNVRFSRIIRAKRVSN